MKTPISLLSAVCLLLGGIINATVAPAKLGNELTPTTYFSYSRNVQCNVSGIAQPQNALELQDLVKNAIDNKIHLKAIGSHHSTNDVICPGGGEMGVAVSMTNFNYVTVYENKRFAKIGAGLTLLEASQQLDAAGLSFIHIPVFLEITIGGAVGTGAHGSTLAHQTSISDQIVAMTIVTGDGSIRSIEGKELDIFRVSLGLLGIIIDVTIPVVPQFKLSINNSLVSEEVYFNGEVDKLLSMDYDLFQAWWFPSSKTTILSVGQRVPFSTPGDDHWGLIKDTPPEVVGELVNQYEEINEEKNLFALCKIESDYSQFLAGNDGGLGPVFSNANGTSYDNPGTGLMYKMLAGMCNECLWNAPNPYIWIDIEFSIPLSQFAAALTDIKAILEKYPACFAASAIWNRFVRPSSGLISSDYGTEPRAHIEFYAARRVDIHKPRLGLEAFQEIEQLLLNKYKGRPHWGKNNLAAFSPPIPFSTIPGLPAFSIAVQKYDPHGIFANDFSERVLHNAPGPRFPYCALESVCYCETDEDCGKETNGLSCRLDGPYQICVQ